MTNKVKDMKELIEEYQELIKIGKIVSVIDPNVQDFMTEMFLVIGFQLDMDGNEHVVALMDRKYKSFTTHIDNVVLMEIYSIDDMFPADRSTFFERLREEAAV